MLEVPLTQGKTAVIDDDDWKLVSGYKWHTQNAPNGLHYAQTSIRALEGKPGLLAMHRLILGAKKGEMVDHINGNGLDNRRANLRLCTVADNMHNQHYRKNAGTSRFKGVYKRADRDKWCAGIKLHGRHLHLGTFANEVDAALAYDTAARRLFGEFAAPNFPEGVRP